MRSRFIILNLRYIIILSELFVSDEKLVLIQRYTKDLKWYLYMVSIAFVIFLQGKRKLFYLLRTVIGNCFRNEF